MARFDGIPVDEPAKSKPRFSGELVEPVSSTAAAAPTGQRSQVAPDGWKYGAVRDTMFGARSVLQSAGGLLGAIGGDAFNNYVVNPVARAVGAQEARPYREEAAALADSLGLPKAQTAGDRVLGDVGEAVAGTGLTLGIGGGINALAAMAPRAAQAVVAPALRSTAPVAQNRLANFLTAQPGLQTASAITGSAAASGTKEAGGSQRNQLLAGLAGGFAPGTLSGLASLATAGRVSATGTVPTAAAGAARRAARGNDASGVQSMIDDFAASGTSPSVGQATGNRSASALETYLGNTPGGSGQIAQRAADQAAAARNATDDLSNRIAAGGADLTPTQVGTNVQQGIYGPGGFVDRTQSVSDRLYGELDRHLPAGEMVPVSNARGALQEINAAINGAPELSHLFDQAALKQIERALVSDTTGGASVLSRPGMRENAAGYRQYLERQAQEAAERNARRQSLGMTVMEPVPSRADIEQNLSITLGNMADGTLPYQALKELRSKVGKQVGATFLTRDAAHADWKKLYAALSRDMEAAATTPEAKKAFARANNYYRLREQRLDAIGKIVQKEGGPEAAYQAMFTGARNGATPLKRVMDSLPAQVRADVSASFLQRMGRASKANQNAAGDAFSMETFLSNWADISPEAKRQLFSNARFGTDYVQNVNKLARMADSIRSGSKVFGNPPGTAKQTALGVTLGGTGLIAGQHVMQGNLKDAAISVASTLAWAGANNLLARMMTSPKAVRWLARNTERDSGDIAGQINTLLQIGKEEDDDEMVELAQRLKAEAAGRR
ncbi:TPA: hypothetical protein RNS97_001058 [Stenotrophomonas maltophilia]|nr:hypothetical protein [Stenotrophomonas maltophilia]HDX0845804.1 hypothetical protein [Stenotrophomonas maltophilia]